MASEQIETVGQCAWCLQRDRQAFALVCPEHVNQWRVLLDDLQRDIQALCRAVGEFDGARPETPQVVLQICTDKAARLEALVSEQAREVARLRERVAALETAARDVVLAYDGKGGVLPAAIDKCEAALAQADDS